MDTTIEAPAVTTRAGGVTVPRWLPLTGAVAGGLTFAADGMIGDFPDGNTSPAALTHWYAVHHAGVAHGGFVSGIEAVFLGLFVATLVHRCRTAPLAAAVIAIGGAATLAHEEWSAASYSLMGQLSTQHGVTPAALQAWQIAGAEFGAPSSSIVLFAGVAAASLMGGAVPRWLGISGLVLALCQLVPAPWGFWASLLVMVWLVVAGVALTLRRTR